MMADEFPADEYDAFLRGLEDDRLPEPDDLDALRARQEEIIKRRICWADVRLEILEKIASGFLEHHHRFNTMLELLKENPVNSDRDLSNYLHSCGARDGKALGQALLKIAGQVTLKHYRQAAADTDWQF